MASSLDFEKFNSSLSARSVSFVTTSPLGRVVECGGWFRRGLWVMFSVGDTKCLSVALAFPENLSDHILTRVFIQQTSNLDTTCIS